MKQSYVAAQTGVPGPGATAQVYQPHTLTVDSTGTVYFADTNRIYKMQPSGLVSVLILTVVAGGGTSNADGPVATQTTLQSPTRVRLIGGKLSADLQLLRQRPGLLGCGAEYADPTGTGFQLPLDIFAGTHVWVADSCQNALRVIRQLQVAAHLVFIRSI